MWKFPLSRSLLLIIVIIPFSLTAGTDGFGLILAGGGGGGGGREDTTTISEDDGGWVAAEHVSNNPSIHAGDDDDASSQVQKLPTGEKPNGCRRSGEDGATGNSHVVSINHSARKEARGRGFCANDDPAAAVVVPLIEQRPQSTPKKQPSEGLFGGRRRGSKPNGYSGKDGGDSPATDDNAAAALFSPVENPNICKDLFHPIPVCHNLVRSFSGDLDDVLFELARCYPR